MAGESRFESQGILPFRDAEAATQVELAASTACSQDENTHFEGRSKRRHFRWSQVARDLVRANLHASGDQLTALITALERESGFPRWACWRFARTMGIRSKRRQRSWAPHEEQRLIKLLDLHPLSEIARLMRRSHSSIFHKLYRMGANVKMGQDSFTKYTLASALNINVSQVEEWISRGWLKTQERICGNTVRVMIEAVDFCDFCRKHTKDVVGNRLRRERLEFVYHFAFPPSHAELLPVRESKKESSAYEQQWCEKKKPPQRFGVRKDEPKCDTDEESA